MISKDIGENTMEENKQKPNGSVILHALTKFLALASLTRTELGRILDYDPSIFTSLVKGMRIYSKLRARLYILTEDEAFAPIRNDEFSIFEQEMDNPPSNLRGYMENNVVPPPIPKKLTLDQKAEEAVLVSTDDPEETIKEPPNKQSNTPTNKKGGETMVNRENDSASKAALLEFKANSGLSFAQLGRILEYDKRSVQRVSKGFRPYATLLARLLILIKDSSFKPITDREQEALDRETAAPPKSLALYLANGSVPDAKCETGDKRKKMSPPRAGPTQESRDVDKQVATSSDLSKILSGEADVGKRGKGKVNFVVSADSFMHLKGTVYNPEINDTKLLIQELRRRIFVFAQIEDSSERIKVLRELGDEIDELYLALEVCRDELPFKAAQSLASLRVRLGIHLKR